MIARANLQEKKEENKKLVVVCRGPLRCSLGLQVEAFFNGLRTDGSPGRIIGITAAKVADAAAEARIKEGDLIVFNGIRGSVEKMCNEALRSQTVVLELQSKERYREPVRLHAAYLVKQGLPDDDPFAQALRDRRDVALMKGYPLPRDELLQSSGGMALGGLAPAGPIPAHILAAQNLEWNAMLESVGPGTGVAYNVNSWHIFHSDKEYMLCTLCSDPNYAQIEGHTRECGNCS